MSKILVVPDVHGRDFWKEPCMNWDGDIIFLGDYHDPYSFQVSKDKSRHNFRDLVNWAKERENKPIFLLGNHCMSYMGGEICCRYDDYNAHKISNLYLDLPNKKFIHIIDNIIFSHSGVLPGWLEWTNLKLEDINNLKYFDRQLYWISRQRGGDAPYGSPIWGDVREYDLCKKLSNYYQVFGHTQLEKEIITDTYACLDCRKCFIVDTETKEIVEWNQIL